jgi:hypothetical protein
MASHEDEGRERDEQGVMILIDETRFPEHERADLAVVNAQLEAVAARRLDSIDLLDDPYRQSKISWKVAMFSSASATSKTRRSKGSLLDADKGSHSNAD